MFDLLGRVAVVTGAASGIGLEVATDLVTKGVKVLFVDVNLKVEEEAARLNQQAFVGDLTDSAVRHAMIRTAEEAYGEPPTIGVFAAGITRDGFAIRLPKGATEAVLFNEESWDLVQNVNLKAPFYCACELVGRLLETGRTKPHMEGDPWIGQLVFIGSISSEGNAAQANYAATKAALRGVVATLNLELNKRLGVRAAIVHPGFTATAMTSSMRSDILEAALALTKDGKLHTVQSVARAVYHAILDDSKEEDFLDHFLHALSPAPTKKIVEEEYHDDGVYLGEPDDPESRIEAIEALNMLGPMPALVED